MANEIRNFPSLEGADDAQPEWWEESDANATLTEVDLSGEGITEKYERALKLVVATAPSYAYQRYTYADEPRLKSGKTYSVAVDVWSVGGIDARVRLQSSAGSLGVASSNSASWERTIVEAVALNGTTLDIRLEADIGTAYFVPLGLVEGVDAPTTQLRPRALRYKYVANTSTVEDLSSSAPKTFADVSLSSFVSPLAVLVNLQIVALEPTAGETYFYHTRRNGDTTAVGNSNTRAYIDGDNSEANTNTWTEMMDDSRTIETELRRTAGAGTPNNLRVYCQGYWEWE